MNNKAAKQLHKNLFHISICIVLVLFLCSCGSNKRVETVPFSEQELENLINEGNEILARPRQTVRGHNKLVIGDDGYWYEIGYDSNGKRRYYLGFYLERDLFHNSTGCSLLYGFTNYNKGLFPAEDLYDVPFDSAAQIYDYELFWCSYDEQDLPNLFLKYDYYDSDIRSIYHVDYESEDYWSFIPDIPTYEFQVNSEGLVDSVYYMVDEYPNYIDYEYDEQGRVTETTIGLHDGALFEHCNFVYYSDSEKNLFVKIFDGGVESTYESMSLRNNDGRTVALAFFRLSDGKPQNVQLWQYSYDEYGDLAAATYYPSSCYQNDISSTEKLSYLLCNMDTIYLEEHASNQPHLYTLERDESGSVTRVFYRDKYQDDTIYHPYYLSPKSPVHIPNLGTLELLYEEQSSTIKSPVDSQEYSLLTDGMVYALALRFTNESNSPITKEDILTGENAKIYMDNNGKVWSMGGEYKMFSSSDPIEPGESIVFFVLFSPISQDDENLHSRFTLFNRCLIVVNPETILPKYS